MIVIRSFRSAAGVTIAGQTFEHLRWTLLADGTLLQDLPAEFVAATRPETGSVHPVLAILDVTGIDDPALAPFPVRNLPASAAEGVGDDLEALGINPLRSLAKSLGLTGFANLTKTALIDAIRLQEELIGQKGEEQSGEEQSGEEEPGEEQSGAQEAPSGNGSKTADGSGENTLDESAQP